MKRTLLIVVVLLVAAVVGLGGFVLGRQARPIPAATAAAPERVEPGPQSWTCSMHPQVRLSGPGSCPICDMPLVPVGVTATAGPGEAPTLTLSEYSLAMAGIETSPVERRPLVKSLHAVGTIEFNETSLATITARVDGYAERLFVNFSGVDIRSGDHLVEIYSPELLVAQQELLIAAHSGADSALVQTSRTKLRLLGLSDDQIDDVLRTGRIAERVTLYSPIDGTVIEKMVVQSSAFKAGDVLYQIANLNTVWSYLDIYEFDLPWVRYGQTVELTAQAHPGRVFQGMVTFVQPVLNRQTRTVRVPVHIENADHALKPGMFVSAVLRADLGTDGRAAATGVEGRHTCPMHPQVLQDQGGPCPVCEMPLEQIPPQADSQPAAADPAAPATTRYVCPMHCEGDQTYAEPGRCPICGMRTTAVEPPTSTSELLAVPVTAVLDSGTRTIVYVERARGIFEPRQVVLGPRADAYVPVLAGLRDGERVATRGGFLIDSQFQISGLPSLFYPGGLGVHAAHEHDPPESAPAAGSTSNVAPGHQPEASGGGGGVRGEHRH